MGEGLKPYRHWGNLAFDSLPHHYRKYPIARIFRAKGRFYDSKKTAMKKRIYKNSKVQIFEQGSSSSGDLIVNFSGGAVAMLAVLIFIVWLSARGFWWMLSWLQAKAQELASFFKGITNTGTDPAVRGYFIAMLLLFVVLVVSLVYLWNRLRSTNFFESFKTYFHGNFDETDYDW